MSIDIDYSEREESEKLSMKKKETQSIVNSSRKSIYRICRLDFDKGGYWFCFT